MKRYSVLFLSLFLMHNVYADIIDDDMVGGCELDNFNTVNNIANLIPVYEPNVYTCSSGEFLPANTLGCQSCPSGYNCAGGNLTFNEENLSGINTDTPIKTSTQYTCSENFLHTNSNNVANLIPVYEPNVHTCLPGYYLPANIDGCTICPANSYCVGGTFTFNETTDQGIAPCPDNKPSVAGASSIDQCLTITLNWLVENETFDTTTCTLNGEISIPSTTPTRTGYTFNGWKLHTNE